MQVIFTVLKVVLRGPFFPQLESILVVKRLLSHPKAMAELEQTWQDMPTCSKPQSCLALCQPMDCSPQAPLSMGFPSKNTGVHCISFSRGSSLPRDQTCVSCVSCIGRRILYQLWHLGSSLARHETENGGTLIPISKPFSWDIFQ